MAVIRVLQTIEERVAKSTHFISQHISLVEISCRSLDAKSGPGFVVERWGSCLDKGWIVETDIWLTVTTGYIVTTTDILFRVIGIASAKGVVQLFAVLVVKLGKYRS